MVRISLSRVHELLSLSRKRHVLVVGDVMLDQFIWGRVSRISPEAPVPVVDFERENFMPGDAANVGDYGKGVVTQSLLEAIKKLCRARGIWVSLDPKPVHRLGLTNLSLLTPNRKEAFELAGLTEGAIRTTNPLNDANLLWVAEKLLGELQPALLLITLGDQGMLLCQRRQRPYHIPTVAQEVFDVSGAGDTVIASFTLAIAAGASPVEAADFSNHAAGVVVGKVGTATVTPEELLASLKRKG